MFIILGLVDDSVYVYDTVDGVTEEHSVNNINTFITHGIELYHSVGGIFRRVLRVDSKDDYASPYWAHSDSFSYCDNTAITLKVDICNSVMLCCLYNLNNRAEFRFSIASKLFDTVEGGFVDDKDYAYSTHSRLKRDGDNYILSVEECFTYGYSCDYSRVYKFLLSPTGKILKITKPAEYDLSGCIIE